jgi:hypothetical protein
LPGGAHPTGQGTKTDLYHFLSTAELYFIPTSWVDHVDQHVHLNKTGAEVTSHWQHEGRS